MPAALDSSPAAAKAVAPLPRRTLVGELLATQLVFAAVVGLVAVASVWSIAEWVVRDNLSTWARQWIEELDSLGGTLYLADDPDRYLQVERYVAKFPEVAFVRYYGADGIIRFADGVEEAMTGAALLGVEELEALADQPAEDAYRFDEQTLAPLVRLAGAIRVTSMSSDGLFDVESLDEVETQSQVVGYVEVGLDYRRYDRQLFQSVLVGSAVTGFTFLVLMIAGRLLLRRGVQPLVDLQAPLAQLAEGASRIDIPAFHHREMAAIAQALARAAAKIRSRDRRLRRLANFDDLTGLPNRRHFEELLALELTASTEPGCAGALLFLDLDHFKYVNDTLGHTAGDVLLKQVASRLLDAVGEHDVVARFGGDEFMVLLRAVSQADSLAVAERLLAEVRDYPLVCERRSFNLHASIGVALLSHPYSVEELLAQADMACHQAKTDGRNLIRVFEPENGAVETLESDLSQLEKLKRALKDDRFVLHFQPIRCLRTGAISHYEVLLRMIDGSRVLAPGKFLAAAARFGLMPEIDRWVIEHALARLAELRRRLPGLRFTINVSGSSFIDGRLPEFVRQTVERNQLSPDAVVLEITEQVAVGSVSDATRQIRELMALGCEFAIDDFGAGYSSLNYLKQLPMQYIKIDGTFIGRVLDSPVDQVIVRSIADIARALGKKTVAEYVGSEAAADLLRKLGIDYAQGFHVGRPSARLIAELTPLAAGRRPSKRTARPRGAGPARAARRTG